MEKIINAQINSQNLSKEVSILTFIVNLIYLAFGVSMLIIGIIYSTMYEYEYSFTVYNTTVVSIIFIVFGSLIIFLSIQNIFFFYIKGKLLLFLAALSTVLILLLFLALLGIGIWGLIVSTDSDSYSDEVRASMIRATHNNGNSDKNSYLTMDWIQSNFKCCGIHSYRDWTTYLGPYDNIKNDCYVPDSCCISPGVNCGRPYGESCDNPDTIIYTNGCLNSYIIRLVNDYLFLAAYSVSISGFSIILWIIYIVLLLVLRHRKKN